jgi:excisionase family DNA binding protein
MIRLQSSDCVYKIECEVSHSMAMLTQKVLTTKEASEILGISMQRVRDLIHDDQIEAEKIGRDWIIKTEDLEKFQENRRGPGRPAKEN